MISSLLCRYILSTVHVLGVTFECGNLDEYYLVSIHQVQDQYPPSCSKSFFDAR